MRKTVSTVVAGAMILGVAMACVGQTAPVRGTRSTIAPLPKQQTPYTADYKITRVRTLADGTTISHESTETRAVDLHGRVMTATTSDNDATGERITRVTVRDSTGGTLTMWQVPGKQATVNTIPKPGSVQCPLGTQPAPSKLQSVTEGLGTDTIDGIEARGTRTTITTPAGTIGNNEPLVHTHETWQAVGFGPFVLDVRVIDNDPQNGKTTKEMTNLTQGDPDASVFEPPSGYEIATRDSGPPACANGQPPVTAPANAPPPAN